MATVDITAETFEETIEKNEIVIVDFWAEWCGPCKSFAPVYEEVSNESEYENIVFGKIDTEAQQELAAHFQIRSIPTLMIFREQVVLFSQPGMLTNPQLKEVIGKVQELDMATVHAEIAKQQDAAE
ncbi:thioredoxin [Leucothrix pacifica]|uniref:Thioredoxin n=1 Tax=Leucothrix pacifica TaxID=1247513 RepID=A0A317CPB3_9GAMM|nr:thioredoxin [Leucothrix pacifica]PWR00068.1 thioredoxin [Leucothrix pacifica]